MAGRQLVAEFGEVTRAVLAIARVGADDRAIAAQICRACIEGLDVDGGAISLLTTRPSRQVLAATDSTAELLEDLQFSLNEGPCMEAATRGRAVLVPDLTESGSTSRWPVFAGALAERAEVGALFALPLQWGVLNLGVLDLYRVAPGVLAEGQLRDVVAAADTAALMLLGLRTDPGGTDGSWLDQAVGSRAEIHQATGMVLAQLGVSTADALARLRAHAFVHDRLLIDVARDVVARRLRFTEDSR
jgi:hypothetical protein